MVVTIVMPVSRPDFLKRIFAQLDMMECDAESTNLLCYVDGPVDLFAKTRDMVVQTKFHEKLCVYRKKGLPNISHLRQRRKRIADIHNEIKGMIGTCDFIFLIEDDTLFPTNTLKKLLHDYTLNPYAGFISGVQVGRWGFNVLGIWAVDNPYNVQKIESLLPKTEILQKIDAAGFFCCLTRRQTYLSCNLEPFDVILGPDVFYGIYARKQGLYNYVDWSISTSHLTKRGEIKMHNTTLQKITFSKIASEKWEQVVE